MALGGVGGDVGGYIKELSAKAKEIQGRFKQIQPGAESETIQKISEEAREVFAQLASLRAAYPENKKIERKIAQIETSLAPILEAGVRDLAEQEIDLRVDLVAQFQVFHKEQFDERLLDPLIKLQERVQMMYERVAVLLESPPEPKPGDTRLALMKSLQEDKVHIAELTRDIGGKRFEVIQERERKMEEASRGTAAPHRARLGVEAFKAGAGEAVAAQIEAEDSGLTTRRVKYGPLEKTEETRRCEEIVHALLVDPDKVTVSEHVVGGETKYFIKLADDPGPGFEMGALLAAADFSQITMSDADLEAYAKSRLLFKPEAKDAKLLAQINDDRRQPPLTPAEKEALLALSPTMRSIINNYTKEGVYEFVNSILRGDVNGVFRAMTKYLTATAQAYEQQRIKLDQRYKQLEEKIADFNQGRVQLETELKEWKAGDSTLNQQRASLITQGELLAAKKKELAAKIVESGGERAAQSPEIEAEKAKLDSAEEALKKQGAYLDGQANMLKDQYKHLGESRGYLEQLRAWSLQERQSLDASSAWLKQQQDVLQEMKTKFEAEKTVIVKEAMLHASALNGALAHLPEQDMSVDANGRPQYLYRCELNMPQKVLDELIQAGKEKLIVWVHGYMSTSHTMPAPGFIGTNPPVLRLVQRKSGKNIAPLSDYDTKENEVLMAPMQVQVMGSTVEETDWGKGGAKTKVTMIYEVPVRSPGVGLPELKTPQDIG